MHEDVEPDPHDEPTLDIFDHDQLKPRVLAEPCPTCVFRAGNPMRLEPGQLAGLVERAVRVGGHIVCHDTLPYGNYPGTPAAICRGYYNAYGAQSTAVQLAERLLGGVLEVPPPGLERGDQEDPAG